MPKKTLVTDIMDGHNRDAPRQEERNDTGLEVHRREGSLPVITMDDIGVKLRP